MSWHELFTTYWSQFTLILLSIGYFVKRLFDHKSKKLEINHTVFQQNKINIINSYMTNYAQVVSMWRQLSIWNILQNKLDAKEIDSIIWPPMNTLKSSELELRIFLNDAEYKHLQELSDSFLSINGKLSDLYFWGNNETPIGKKVNEFEIFKQDILKKNDKILSEVTRIIQYSFKS